MTTPEQSGPPLGPHEAYLTATAAATEMLKTADHRTAAAVHAQLATARAVMHAAGILAELRAGVERFMDAQLTGSVGAGREGPAPALASMRRLAPPGAPRRGR
jgi:hypothetical protein